MRTRQKVRLQGYKPLFERLYSMGVDTPWERYEKTLPQNRLAGAGFFCASVCLDGPCHVDPWGGTPISGVCGRTAPEMAASWLLTTAARGFVRRLRDAAKLVPDADIRIPREVINLTEITSLPRVDIGEVSHCLQEAAFRAADLEASIGPGQLPLKAGEAKCGLGARNPLRPAVLFDGLDYQTMSVLQDQFASTGIDCLITGDEHTGFGSGLPVLCPSSLASTVSIGGVVDAVIAGERSYMKEGICRSIDGAARVFFTKDLEVCDVVSSARAHFCAYSPMAATSGKAVWDNVGVPDGEVLIIGGGLGVKKTCGEFTIGLAQAALNSGFEVVAFGDAAAVLGEAGLIGSGSGPTVRPWDNPSGLGLVMALHKDRSFKTIPLMAFPEAVISTDVAAALETSALAIPTYFGSPLPVDGPGLPEALGWNGGTGLPFLCAETDETPKRALERLISLRRSKS